jgi:hypothetical protein
MRLSQILLFIILSLGASCQNDSLIGKTAVFITDAAKLSELNPMYQSETDKINALLAKSMAIHLTGDNQKENAEEIKVAFNTLYQNSTSVYEDSQEERRFKSRRAICFAAISLMSNPEKAPIFIEYAKFSINGNTHDVELMEQQYLGLMFIELLLKYESKNLNTKDVVYVDNFLSDYENMIPKEFFARAKQLLDKFK